MEYKDFEALKGVVRRIRGGEAVAGYQMDGDILREESTLKSYRVNGKDRLRVVELVEKVETKVVAVKVPPPAERTDDVCSECGRPFTRSKFNPYFTKCQDCRRKARQAPGGADRKFTCLKCGKEFFISKYQPYLNPSQCQHCNRNEGIRRRQKRRAKRLAAVTTT